MSLNEYKIALEYLNRTIKLNNNIPHVYHYRGIILTELGDYNAACKNFKKAVKLGLKESVKWINENCGK